MNLSCCCLVAISLSAVLQTIAAQPAKLSVAAIQIEARGSIEKNTDAILEYLKTCEKENVRIAVFQECVTTGYDKSVINAASEEQLVNAEQKIAEACKQFGLYAVIGTPYFNGDKRLNTAVVFNPEGEIVVRYAKIQLVGGDDWAEPGEQMMVFAIDGVPCSIIICHDERYPELVKLPVMAGARLVFYVSSESSVAAEHKLVPYRAQIAARADENDVFIIQANEPAMASHGQSRIIGPDGNIIAEAGMFGDEMITAALDMSKATGSTANKSLRYGLLKDWWQEGIKRVKVLE